MSDLLDLTKIPLAAHKDMIAQEIILRLSFIQQRLASVPDDKFYMRNFIESDIQETKEFTNDQLAEQCIDKLKKFECDTAGCVAGWMLTVPFFWNLGLRFDYLFGNVYLQDDRWAKGREALVQITGLHGAIVEELFYAHMDAKPADKIEEIDQIIAGIKLDTGPHEIARVLSVRRWAKQEEKSKARDKSFSH